TVYIERRIVQALYGKDRATMEAMLGRQDLEEELQAVDEDDERLALDLAGRDPDTALTDVAYEKGALFLSALEAAYGREVFDRFLQRGFETHAFGSVTTRTFEAFLAEHLLSRPLLPGRRDPDVKAWVYVSGIPPDAPVFASDAFAAIDRSVEAFARGELPLESLRTERWTPHEWLHFLRARPVALPAESLRALDEKFGLTQSSNAEILAEWLEQGIERNYRAIDARLEQFLEQVGRRKFLMPLYQALLRAGREADARRIYAVARAGYHPITRGSIDALLSAVRDDDRTGVSG